MTETSTSETYKNAAAPTEARVRDLLEKMTLEEKIAQLAGKTTLPPMIMADPAPAFGIVDKEGNVDEEVARRSMPDGAGHFFLLSGAPVADYAASLNAIQSWAINSTRLGIPIFFHCEGLHGASLNGATTFPQSIGLGSTWNRELIRRVFAATAKELRTAGASIALAPVFDLARDPRYGRIEESWSEDPYLVGELAVEAVLGLQGDDGRGGPDTVIATAKHFVHGSPENGTNVGPHDVSERTMREVFLPPFEKAISRGGLGAVMSSYNENNGGVASTANPWLLRQILRDEWGFEGLVISDYGAVGRLHTEQAMAASFGAAGELAFRSGLDVEMPSPEGFSALQDAVSSGRIDEADIDRAVTRVLTAKFDAGLFENPYAELERISTIVGASEHAELAREAADQTAVLLKNDGALLPLDPTAISSIAVIGPNADKVRYGTYAGTPPYFVTILDGIRDRVGDEVEVTYAEGVKIGKTDTVPGHNKIVAWEAPDYDEDTELIRQAVQVASEADTVVLALGGNENISNEAFGDLMVDMLGGEPVYGDTDELELPGRQNELVREIMKLGKRVVAVLLNGRPYSIQQLSATVPAIVEGWYSGQETGNAIAGILFGDTNPSGRLPVTIARNVGQLPVYYSQKPAARLGYVFNDNSPLYPFGFGLSYTEFAYGEPVLDEVAIDRDATATVSIEVTNAGARAGAEVVQMYVHPQVSSVVQPVLRLAGFERIELDAGESRTVSFEVGPAELAILDSRMQRTVEPGVVEIMVGRNVADTARVLLTIND